jgi:hypothetical protein
MWQNNTRRSGVLASAFSLLICALILMAAAGMADAQSGRKIPKRPSSPDPLPPKSTEPAIEESKPKDDKSQIPVMVVSDRSDINSSPYWTSAVLQGCLGRLSDSKSVRPTSGREMNRKQASDAAKASADTYVVIVQVEVDPTYRNRTDIGNIDMRHVYVNYTLFSPGTGKVKTSGNVYPYNRAVGGVPLPGRIPNSPASAEYSLRYAGRDVADRVLASIGMARPPDKPY